MGVSIARLGMRNPFHHAGTLGQQRLELLVDLVDLPPESLNRIGVRSHRFFEGLFLMVF